MKYYKLLKDNNIGYFSKFKWDVSGKWMSAEGELRLCTNGFHVIRQKDIINWVYAGPHLYEVKIKGKKIVYDGKICAQSVRVIKKVESWTIPLLIENVLNPALLRFKNNSNFINPRYKMRKQLIDQLCIIDDYTNFKSSYIVSTLHTLFKFIRFPWMHTNNYITGHHQWAESELSNIIKDIQTLIEQEATQ